MDPVTILVAAANIVPALAKLFHSDKADAIGEGVGAIASTVAGVVDPKLALEKIQQTPALQTDFQLKIMEKMKEWDEMIIKDRQDARDRDVKLAQAGFRNTRANWLVLFAMALIVGLIIVVLKMAGVPEWVQGVILFALGRAWGYLDQIYNFEFGTTKQSAAKDMTISDLTKQVKEQ